MKVYVLKKCGTSYAISFLPISELRAEVIDVMAILVF